MICTAHILREAVPMGSKRAFVSRKTGKAHTVEQNAAKLRPFQSELRDAMLKSAPETPSRAPIMLTVQLYFKRPKSHYRTGKRSNELRDDAPKWCARTPDADKCLRGIGDAGTGIWWADDSQIAYVSVEKRWAERGETCVQAHELDFGGME